MHVFMQKLVVALALAALAPVTLALAPGKSNTQRKHKTKQKYILTFAFPLWRTARYIVALVVVQAIELNQDPPSSIECHRSTRVPSSTHE
jgi:hypothetical protein